MAFTPLEKMQIKNAVERVLHVPGNYRNGPLEMTMVFDCNLAGDYIRQIGKDMAALLKSHSGIFRNVRLNTVCWIDDVSFIQESGSLSHLQMGRCFNKYEHIYCEKKLEILMGYLKRFHARSKIIILFTDGNYCIGEQPLLRENIHPFLYRKLIVLYCNDHNADGRQPGKITVSSGMEFTDVKAEEKRKV